MSEPLECVSKERLDRLRDAVSKWRDAYEAGDENACNDVEQRIFDATMELLYGPSIWNELMRARLARQEE